ncbi:hypothetical protein DSO57_1024793 [Entomophthora muscae]|uniref:Uncharacterized protein n=1 Tax=Entomophthora muscae TaxID=34485 RepID=A0ACC2T2E6_9FUNG|nr:hypothetical protein DSO57_1024793 [Entomophthora muscae]
MSKKNSWMDPVLPTTSKAIPSEPLSSDSNPEGKIAASWLDPVLPVDKKPAFKADFSQKLRISKEKRTLRLFLLPIWSC